MLKWFQLTGIYCMKTRNGLSGWKWPQHLLCCCLGSTGAQVYVTAFLLDQPSDLLYHLSFCLATFFTPCHSGFSYLGLCCPGLSFLCSHLWIVKPSDVGTLYDPSFVIFLELLPLRLDDFWLVLHIILFNLFGIKFFFFFTLFLL